LVRLPPKLGAAVAAAPISRKRVAAIPRRSMLHWRVFGSWCGPGSVESGGPHAFVTFVTFVALHRVKLVQIQVFPYLSPRRESVDFYSGFLRLSKSGRPKIKEEE
jgi:hypothetical protein